MASEGRIDRDQIQQKLEEIHREVSTTASAAKPAGLAIAAVAVVAIVGAAYLLGRRKGKKKSTFVEIRRV